MSDFILPARLPSALRPPRGWMLKRDDGTEEALDVPARTQEQRDRGKHNFESPPPPSGFKRHGQTDALR